MLLLLLLLLLLLPIRVLLLRVLEAAASSRTDQHVGLSWSITQLVLGRALEQVGHHALAALSRRVTGLAAKVRLFTDGQVGSLSLLQRHAGPEMTGGKMSNPWDR